MKKNAKRDGKRKADPFHLHIQTKYRTLIVESKKHKAPKYKNKECRENEDR